MKIVPFSEPLNAISANAFILVHYATYNTFVTP